MIQNEIQNLNGYLARMQKSVLDKLFFLDKVFEPFDNIVDFGCANGDLFKAIYALFGDEYRYYGYDISPEMVRAAKSNVPFATVVADWDSLNVPFEKSLLNISSVVHEVYSYCPPEEIAQFWNRVFHSGFRYVCIRDMAVSETTLAAADEKEIALVRAEKRYAAHLKDYEAVWGPLQSRKDLVHYLLKYKYTENWEREVNENYLGLSAEGLMKLIPEEYEVTWCDRFTLPYIAWQIRNDFGMELNLPTHVKLILKKRGAECRRL